MPNSSLGRLFLNVRSGAGAFSTVKHRAKNNETAAPSRRVCRRRINASCVPWQVRIRKKVFLPDHLDHGTTAGIDQHHIIVLVDEEIVVPDVGTSVTTPSGIAQRPMVVPYLPDIFDV